MGVDKGGLEGLKPSQFLTTINAAYFIKYAAALKMYFYTIITGYRSHLREPKISKISWWCMRPQTSLEFTGMLCTLQIFQISSPPPPPPPTLKRLSTPIVL